MAKFAIDIFDGAAERFESAQAEVLKEWQPSCGCDAPGLLPQCRNCSDCHQLRFLTQLKLSTTPEDVFPPALPPQTTQAYPSDVKEKALEMYTQGYPLSEIQAETGVKNRQAIRVWAREANIPPRIDFYSAEVREYCLRLYELGKKPSEIEKITGVPADTIRGWAHEAGIIRNLPRSYSNETKTHCLSLYQQGKSPKEIAKLTNVLAGTIQNWVAAAKIGRRPGSPRKYSDSVRKQCFLLRQEGKDYREIEGLTGVSETTIRGWVKTQSSSTSDK